MNRWDEGSWDTDPQRHGRFTIIADRGKMAFTSGTLGSPYLLAAILYEIRRMLITNWLCFEMYQFWSGLYFQYFWA